MNPFAVLGQRFSSLKLKLRPQYVLGVVFILLLTGVLYFQSSSVRLVSSSPKDGAKNIAPPEKITLEFSKALATASLAQAFSESPNQVEIRPRFNASIETREKTVTITPLERLKYHEKYTIEIRRVSSSSGYKGKNALITFSTGAAPTSLPPKEQTIANLPYRTDNFTISYVEATGSVAVDIYNAPIDQYKKEALEYLEKNGVTEKNAKIVFFTAAHLSDRSGP